MTFMTLAQARENFFAAMQTLRSSKVRSALTVNELSETTESTLRSR